MGRQQASRPRVQLVWSRFAEPIREPRDAGSGRRTTPRVASEGIFGQPCWWFRGRKDLDERSILGCLQRPLSQPHWPTPPHRGTRWARRGSLLPSTRCSCRLLMKPHGGGQGARDGGEWLGTMPQVRCGPVSSRLLQRPHGIRIAFVHIRRSLVVLTSTIL